MTGYHPFVLAMLLHHSIRNTSQAKYLISFWDAQEHGLPFHWIPHALHTCINVSECVFMEVPNFNAHITSLTGHLFNVHHLMVTTNHIQKRRSMEMLTVTTFGKLLFIVTVNRKCILNPNPQMSSYTARFAQHYELLMSVNWFYCIRWKNYTLKIEENTSSYCLIHSGH